MSLLLVSELSAAKLHAAASNDVFEGLSEQDSKLAQDVKNAAAAV